MPGPEQRYTLEPSITAGDLLPIGQHPACRHHCLMRWIFEIGGNEMVAAVGAPILPSPSSGEVEMIATRWWAS